jgi:hypothetical protein
VISLRAPGQSITIASRTNRSQKVFYQNPTLLKNDEKTVRLTDGQTGLMNSKERCFLKVYSKNILKVLYRPIFVFLSNGLI